MSSVEGDAGNERSAADAECRTASSSSSCFVVFEGIDGSGKSTQAALLARRLQKEGGGDLEVLHTREPTKDLASIIAAGSAVRWTPEDYLIAFCVDREIHASSIITPALNKPKTVVVCDRYMHSSFAYQGAQGVSDDMLSIFHRRYCKSAPVPDVVILLDCPVDVAARRRAKRGEAEDQVFERDDGYQEAVRQRYLKMAEESPAVFVVVPSSADQEETHRLVWEALRGRILPLPLALMGQ
jgi:dTMP kinase